MAEQFLTPGLWDRDRVQQTLEHAGETVTVRTVERRIEGLLSYPRSWTTGIWSTNGARRSANWSSAP